MAEALQRALGWPEPGPAPIPAPTLLLGPARSGRSALLFRAALAAPGPRALFLAPSALQRLPGTRRGDSEALGLQRVQFLYPPSLPELLRLVASLHHSLPGSPSLILLDGLEQYLAGSPGPQAVARLSALLVDTASYFTGRLGTEPHRLATCCQLIASLRVPSEAEADEHLGILQRYFPARCWLCPDSLASLDQEDCGADRVFRARLAQPGAPDREWRLEFGLDGEMKVSPLPWGLTGAASDTDRAAGAEK